MTTITTTAALCDVPWDTAPAILIHGDCRDVFAHIPAQSVDAIIVDPPYGQTRNAWDAIIPFDVMWAGIRRVLNYGAFKPLYKVNDQYYPTSIITEHHNADRSHHEHPTQKPVGLMEDLVTTYTEPGQVVLDFTMGSGSTGVACMRTGRRFIGVELLEEYAQVALRRVTEAQAELPRGYDVGVGRQQSFWEE